MNAKKAKQIRKAIREKAPDVAKTNHFKLPRGQVRENPATFNGLVKSAKKMAQNRSDWM